MLRRFIYSCIHKDYVRVAQYGIRSNQVTCGEQRIGNNTELQTRKTKYGQKNYRNAPVWENPIFTFSHLTSEIIRPILRNYQHRNSKNYNENLKDNIIHWVTGVLRTSSIILSHKWIHSDRNEVCPFVIAKVRQLKKLCESRSFSRDHFLLAVNTSQYSDTEKPVDQSNDEQESSLKISVEAFHKVVMECNGSLLNKMALKMRKFGHHNEAAMLFRQASEYGHLSGLFNLAICYELGLGFETSLRKAFSCYKQAADAGHCKSMYNVATFFYEGKPNGEIDKNNGQAYMEKAANLGLVQAQLFLALQFTEQQNWKDAVKYFKMAAEQNDVNSLFHLATCYEHGLGVKKDLLKAYKLFKKAADFGHTQAMFCLGESHQYALRGVTRNYEEAMQWYSRASSKGHVEAANRLELLKYEISQRNEERLLDMLESNPVSKLLQPIQNISRNFHKSSSMPSLQQLAAPQNVDDLPKKDSKTFHGSMLCINQTVQYDANFIRLKLTSEQLNAIL